MKPRLITIIAALVAGLIIAPACVQAQVSVSRQKFSLKPVRDTFTYTGAEGLANHGKYTFLEVGYGFAGLICFDLSAIPPGYKFVKAKLRLTQTTSAPFEFAKTCRIYTPAFTWDENYVLKPNDKVIRFIDYGDVIVSVTQGSYSRVLTYSGQNLVDLCNAWHNSQTPFVNGGFLLLPASVGSPNDALVIFDSSEGYTPPELILTGEIAVTP